MRSPQQIRDANELKQSRDHLTSFNNDGKGWSMGDKSIANLKRNESNDSGTIPLAQAPPLQFQTQYPKHANHSKFKQESQENLHA